MIRFSSVFARQRVDDNSMTLLSSFLTPLEVLPFDEHAAWVYGDLRAGLECRGEPIGALDTMIASHALAMAAHLVTKDPRKFERVAGFKPENQAP